MELFSLNIALCRSKQPSIYKPRNGTLRLSGGYSPCRGRLEIFYNGVWGTVCDDGFTSVAATVACRQLLETDKYCFIL